MVLESTEPLTEMSTKNISWGMGGGGGRQTAPGGRASSSSTSRMESAVKMDA